MHIEKLTNSAVGFLVLLQEPLPRDERGLSQSAENAVLLAGAVGVAFGIVAAVKIFIAKNMPH